MKNKTIIAAEALYPTHPLVRPSFTAVAPQHMHAFVCTFLAISIRRPKKKYDDPTRTCRSHTQYDGHLPRLPHIDHPCAISETVHDLMFEPSLRNSHLPHTTCFASRALFPCMVCVSTALNPTHSSTQPNSMYWRAYCTRALTR